MGKYLKLGVYLNSSTNNISKLTFAEVENILGFHLPSSARKYPAWWANNGESHTHAVDGWLGFGWRAKVDLNNQAVIFTKKGYVETERKTDEIVSAETSISSSKFEDKARVFMSKYYSKPLFAGKHPRVHKTFDMLSDDNEIVGDAKFYTMVRGKSLPPAKFATIAEHVWLLEKTEAKHKFLIFGNDKRVPEEWLKRYGNLVDGVEFFFWEEKMNSVQKLM
ncbi:MAG: hypothetical protein JXA98_08890 [Methanosarcinaceae archaeon]|nr:hypothetical protein [Methanosarcinaceae archaeon]